MTRTAPMFLLLLLAACHSVTEFEEEAASRLYLVRTSDFQVQTSMEGFTGGRTLVPTGAGNMIVIGADGVLHRLNMNSLQVDTSYAIGGGSGSGYFDAATADNGNLYVIGPGSSIIEVDLSDNVLEDNFTVTTTPGAISASTKLGRLYVLDDGIGDLYEVRTSDNTVINSSGISDPADVMIDRINGRFLVVACDDEYGSLYGMDLDLGFSFWKMPLDAEAPCGSILSFGPDSCFAVACPEWSGSGKVVIVQGYRDPHKVEQAVAGHPLDMCYNSNPGNAGYLFVLSRSDDSRTLVTVLEFPQSYLGPEMAGQFQMDGYPRDIACPGNGEYLVVLTSE